MSNQLDGKSKFLIEGPMYGQVPALACEKVVRALPGWFGLESATLQYIREAAELPSWVVADENGAPAGFMSIKIHSPYAAEISVIGVLKAYHRQGIGRKLVAAAEDWLRHQGVEFLQVKTLSPANPDPGYARTRAFYLAVGFRPLEEFPLLWSEEHPCLMLVKWLGHE